MTEVKSFIRRAFDVATNSENLEKIAGKTMIFVVKFIIAIVVFFILKKIINYALKKYDDFRDLEKNRSLQTFSKSILKLTLNFIAIMITLLILGVKQSAFIGLLGGAGLGIGLALKDTLANFAGGVILILFKAYEIGDFIEINGQGGSVHEINVFATTLNTIDNKRILVPNGLAVGNQITNYTRNKMRRVDITFGIAYDIDFRKAVKILEDIASKNKLVNQKLEKTIRLKELADSSVNITCRVWCKSTDYWTVYFDMMEDAKLRFDEANISIPFPQMDVHFHKVEEEGKEEKEKEIA